MMQQKVNLYLDGFETPGITLSAGQMVATIVGSVVVLGLAALLMGPGGMKDKVAELGAQKNGLAQEVEGLQAQLDARKVDPQLKSRLSSLERNVQAKQQVIAMLGASGQSNKRGFSSYLRGLAQKPVTGVWLTNIEFHDGGKNIVLEGDTTKPENVPVFLAQIGEEKAFQRREFETLRIERKQGGDADEKLRFEIRSSAEKRR